MKKLLILPLLLLYFTATSQNYYNDDIPWQFYNFEEETNIQDSLIMQYEIHAKKSYSLNKEGDKELYSFKLYEGTNNEFDFYFKNKREINHKESHTINDYNIYSWKQWGTQGKQINEYIELNGKKHLKEKIYIIRNKMFSKTTYFRNDTGRIDSTLYFRKREPNAYSKTIYNYKNGKLAETKNYIKGKLKYVRKYDCTPLGEVVKKINKTAVCVNTEFDKEGNKIVVREYTSSKGEISKNRVTYKGISKEITKNEHFDKDNNLIYYFEKTVSKEITARYTNKGKERYKNIRYFDQDGNTIKRESYYKGKKSSSSLYEFNKKGQKTKVTFFDKKNKQSSTVTYEYDKRGLMIKRVTKNKKKTYTNFFEYS